MVQRICPVCDQVMKSAHYCRTCKRLVKNPWIREVGYYLNERHPQDERDCSYHEAASGQMARSGKPKVSAIPNVARKYTAEPNTRRQPMSERQNQERAYQSYRPNNPAGTISTKKNVETIKNRRLVNIIVVVIIIVYVLSMMLGGGLLSYWSSMRLNRAIYDVDPYEYGVNAQEAYDDDMEEYAMEDGYDLDDDEVIARGERCKSQGHFDMQGELLQEPIIDALVSMGYEPGDCSRYSTNQEREGYSWYSSVIYMDLDSEDSVQFVEIDSDTVTGELHSVSIVLDDGSCAVAVASLVLEQMEEQGAIPKDYDYVQLAKQELVNLEQERVGSSYIYGDLNVDVSCYDDSGYWIMISHR